MNPLDLEYLIGTAEQATGARFDRSEPWFDAYSRLIHSLNNESGLEEERAYRTCPQLLLSFIQRARRDALLAAHPEILEVPIEAPVFITGFPRTGTTLLHNLLASHPDHDAPRLWQMRTPFPPEDAGDDWEELAAAETAGILRLLYELVPEMEAIHPMRAEWPDECNFLFRNSFASMVFAFQYPVPSYMRWLTQADLRWAYGEYRVWLQILRWRWPGQRLVLKDPSHLWHLDALLDAFPDATVIHTHREPSRCIPSLASLCFAMHKLESTWTDPAAAGAYALDMTSRGLETLERVRATQDPRFVDLPYAELVKDPIATIESICARIGSPFHDGVKWRIEDWLDANRQGNKGKHQYTPEDFGLTRAGLDEVFARYRARFLPEDGPVFH